MKLHQAYQGCKHVSVLEVFTTPLLHIHQRLIAGIIFEIRTMDTDKIKIMLQIEMHLIPSKIHL